MNKHTPGKWKVNFKKFSQVQAENGAVIAEFKTLTTMVNLQANAQLAAASPDLLEALQNALPCLQEYGIGNQYEKACAAIAKAEGKQ